MESYFDFLLLTAALTVVHVIAVNLIPASRRVIKCAAATQRYYTLTACLQALMGACLFPFLGLWLGIGGFMILWIILEVCVVMNIRQCNRYLDVALKSSDMEWGAKRAMCAHLWQCSEDGYTCVRCNATREPFHSYKEE